MNLVHSHLQFAAHHRYLLCEGRCGYFDVEERPNILQSNISFRSDGRFELEIYLGPFWVLFLLLANSSIRTIFSTMKVKGELSLTQTSMSISQNKKPTS